MNELVGNWNFPTPIRYGAGRLRELPVVCRELGMTCPLLVTDPGLAGLPMVAEALAVNEEAGLKTRLFTELRPNPVARNVTDGVAAYQRGVHDGIIAFGGGSAIDVAKAVALMVGQSRPLFDFEDVGDNWTRANSDAIAPIVAVPTTAGTGSEVGRCSVILDEGDQIKKILFHPRMLPSRVILDPVLTVGLPSPLTAAVGLDALSHSLEALFATGFHPLADGIALESLRLIKGALPRAYDHGDDLGARGLMLVASLMGATAFQKGLGAIHALSHPVSAKLDTHHGLANAVFMPYVVAFNRSAIAAPAGRLARYLDLPGAGVDAVLEWILGLRQALGISPTAAGLGLTEEMASELAPRAARDPTAATNPIEVTPGIAEQLYRAAVRGDLEAAERAAG